MLWLVQKHQLALLTSWIPCLPCNFSYQRLISSIACSELATARLPLCYNWNLDRSLYAAHSFCWAIGARKKSYIDNVKRYFAFRNADSIFTKSESAQKQIKNYIDLSRSQSETENVRDGYKEGIHIATILLSNPKLTSASTNRKAGSFLKHHFHARFSF